LLLHGLKKASTNYWLVKRAPRMSTADEWKYDLAARKLIRRKLTKYRLRHKLSVEDLRSEIIDHPGTTDFSLSTLRRFLSDERPYMRACQPVRSQQRSTSHRTR
jgi:hypothetical protein